jgi:hypothetical protein
MPVTFGKLTKPLSDLSFGGKGVTRKQLIASKRICRNCSAFYRSKWDYSPRSYGLPMQLSEDSGKFEGGPDPWGPSVIEPVWNEFCIQSLLTRIWNKEQLSHFFCWHKTVDITETFPVMLSLSKHGIDLGNSPLRANPNPYPRLNYIYSTQSQTSTDQFWMSWP